MGVCTYLGLTHNSKIDCCHVVLTSLIHTNGVILTHKMDKFCLSQNVKYIFPILE